MPRAALPIQAAQHRRRKLGHGGKADQPDTDQRIGLAGQMKVNIAQHQHAQNGRPPNAQQHPGQVAPGIGPEMPGAQQQGHDQLVADHGGHRNRFHNHHARGRREPTHKSKQCQRLLPRRQRQREHKVLGVHLPGAEIQQAAQGNRQHKQVDGQQVQGKHPHRPAQVALAHVFHHHHLKLARQKNHRKHGQQRQRKPLRPGKATALLQPQQRRQFGHGPGAGKQIGKTVKQAVHHEQAHRQKRHQLDHRLKGNGRHHALMPLGGVQVPRAKHHGKASQRQRHVKGAVLAPVQQRLGVGAQRAGQQGIARRHAFELQCDVGHDADHGNQRHQPGQQGAFAVAAANEVGNGGDAVGLGDADHFAQHHPAQHHGQGGAQVNRQKPDAAGGGAPHAAKVSPGGAVHRQRERVSPGVGNQGTPLRGTTITQVGHGKQQQQVSKRGADDGRGRQHAQSSCGAWPGRSIQSANTAISPPHSKNKAMGNSGMPNTSTCRSHKPSKGKLNSKPPPTNSATNRWATRPLNTARSSH